jgi:hypothetical protein
VCSHLPVHNHNNLDSCVCVCVLVKMRQFRALGYCAGASRGGRDTFHLQHVETCRVLAVLLPAWRRGLLLGSVWFVCLRVAGTV